MRKGLDAPLRPVPKVLKAIRFKEKMTQSEFADFIGKNKKWVANREQNLYNQISLPHIFHICDKVGYGHVEMLQAFFTQQLQDHNKDYKVLVMSPTEHKLVDKASKNLEEMKIEIFKNK